MLTWDPVNTYGQHWLKLQGIEIALVDKTVDPAWPWSVTVDRQRGIESKLVGGRSKTLEHGKKMAERWARANLPRLEVEVARKAAARVKHHV
jgi:hypothetical protein